MKITQTHLTPKVLTIAIACSALALAEDEKPAAAGLRAQAAGKRDPEPMFKRLDTNGDGKISKEEFEKGAERLRERMREHGGGAKGGTAGRGQIGSRLFDHLDTNKDGVLSLEEFKKLGELRAHGAGRKSGAGTGDSTTK